MVAVLAHALAVIRRDRFGGTIDPGRAAAALYHDASEILTGDLPTPVKYANEKIQAAYKAIEDDAAQRLVEMLPRELQGSFAAVLHEDDPEVLTLVKAADKLSAHLKCLEELKAGNQEFRSAAEQTRQALEDYRLPELAYFLEHFLPAFSCTLEQLCVSIKDGSLCGLGQTAPNPVLTTIRYFRDEYEAHIRDKKCPAHECSALLKISIDPAKCKGCTVCARKCPVECISGERKTPHVIDQSSCIKCKQCVSSCKFDAIVVD